LDFVRDHGEPERLGLALFRLELVFSNLAKQRPSQDLAKQWRSARLLSGSSALSVPSRFAVCFFKERTNVQERKEEKREKRERRRNTSEHVGC